MFGALAAGGSSRVYLANMVNCAETQTHPTLGAGRKMPHFLQDLILTSLAIMIVGLLFSKTHGKPLQVAATTTCLVLLPAAILTRLKNIVVLVYLPHPLRAIIMGETLGWCQFFNNEAQTEYQALQRVRVVSEAWAKFQTENPDLANQAKVFGGQRAEEEKAKYLQALGKATVTGAAAIMGKALGPSAYKKKP